MQHNNNIPRASFSITNVRQTYNPNLGQFQMGSPESYPQQNVPTSHCGPLCPHLRRIQRDEMLLSMMLRHKNRKEVTKNGKTKAQTSPNQNQCPINNQCRRSDCNKPTGSNGGPPKDELYNLQNDQLKAQARQVKKFQSKTPVYVRCKSGQATDNNCPAREVIENCKQTKSENPKCVLNGAQSQNIQSEISISNNRTAAGNATSRCQCPSKEDIENFYDCQSNSRSSIVMTTKINDVAATSSSKSQTRKDCQMEPQTLKYSLETAILDLYEGNFKTRPTAKREEIDACNFLLDLIKERINSMNCNDSVEKNTSIKATRSCVCFRQFGACDCEGKCEELCVTCNVPDHHNSDISAEAIEEDVNQHVQEEQEEDDALKCDCCAEKIEDLEEDDALKCECCAEKIDTENRSEAYAACLENEGELYDIPEEDSSVIAETTLNVKESCEIAEVKPDDENYTMNIINSDTENMCNSVAKESCCQCGPQPVQHEEELSEIAKTKLATENDCKREVASELKEATTSKWQLDEKQFSRAESLGLLGVRSVHQLEESCSCSCSIKPEKQEIEKIETYKSKEKEVEEEQQESEIYEGAGYREYDFKEGRRQKPLVIDEQQLVRNETLGVLGTHIEVCDDKIVEKTKRESRQQDEKLTNKSKESKEEYIDEDKEMFKYDYVEPYVFTEHKKQGLIDIKGTQLGIGKQYGIICAKSDQAEGQSNTSLVIEEQNNDEIMPQKDENKDRSCNCSYGISPAKIEEKDNKETLTRQNQFLPEDQNLASEEPISYTTEETENKLHSEWNCSCLNCLPQKKPIELKNHRITYTNCCRKHQNQKKDYIEDGQNDTIIARNSITPEHNCPRLSIKKLSTPRTSESLSQEYNSSMSSNNKLCGRQDNHKKVQQNGSIRTSGRLSRELNNSKSSRNKLPDEDTKLAFFKCLAEKIRGKRKRLHAECNNQEHRQLQTTGQEHTDSSRYYTDDRKVQSARCSHATCPWISNDSNPYHTQNIGTFHDLNEQQIKARHSCCNRSTCPWITRGPIKLQMIPNASENDRLFNEPMEHRLSMQTSCCNRPTCPRLVKVPFKHQPVTDARILREPKEQTNMGNFTCNRDNCPWIAKESTQHQQLTETLENATVFNEPTKHRLSMQHSWCNRPTCPHLAREYYKNQAVTDARVSSEPKEQTNTGNFFCNRATCPWIAKESTQHQPLTDTLENTRDLNELTEHRLSMQNSSCNRPTCPRLARESFQRQVVTDTRVSNDVIENARDLNKPTEHRLSMQNSSCNRPTCPRLARESFQRQVVTDTRVSNDVIENARDLNEHTEHRLSMQNSSCNRPTCPRLARESFQRQVVTDTSVSNDVIENARDLNEPTEHRLSMQNSSCNRPTCPRLARESFQRQVVTDTRVSNDPKEQTNIGNFCCNQPLTDVIENARDLNEPTENRPSMQNSSCNHPTYTQLESESFEHQAVTDTQISNDPKEQTNIGNFSCNQPLTDAIENARDLNEPTEHRLSLENSTCPQIARESSNYQLVSDTTVSKEQTNVPTSYCNCAISSGAACFTDSNESICCNGSTCPLVAKYSIKQQAIADETENTTVFYGPNEQVDMENSSNHTADFWRLKESLNGNTRTDTMKRASATEAEIITNLSDNDEENDTCNSSTCPLLIKEPAKQQDTEVHTCNPSTCPFIKKENVKQHTEINKCNPSTCPFIKKGNVKQQDTEINTCTPILQEAETISAIKDVTESQEPIDEVKPNKMKRCSFADEKGAKNTANCNKQKAASECTILKGIDVPLIINSAKDMSVDCACFKSDEPKEEFEFCETNEQQYIGATKPCRKMKRSSKTRCNIPPPHVPYFSEVYKSPGEKLWNNPSVPEEYFSCASCTSGSSSGSSASSNSSNYCVFEHINTAGTQLRQEQESSCRCLKCLSASYYQGSMHNSLKPQNFTNTMRQTENGSNNQQHKDDENTSGLDNERPTSTQYTDFVQIVSAGHSTNPNFKAGKRKRC